VDLRRSPSCAVPSPRILSATMARPRRAFLSRHGPGEVTSVRLVTAGRLRTTPPREALRRESRRRAGRPSTIRVAWTPGSRVRRPRPTRRRRARRRSSTGKGCLRQWSARRVPIIERAPMGSQRECAAARDTASSTAISRGRQFLVGRTGASSAISETGGGDGAARRSGEDLGGLPAEWRGRSP